MDTIKTIADLSKLNGFARNVTVSLTPSEQRLIAAAPGLLACLIELQALLSDEPKNNHELFLIKQAIAKATGGAE